MIVRQSDAHTATIYDQPTPERNGEYKAGPPLDGEGKWDDPYSASHEALKAEAAQKESDMAAHSPPIPWPAGTKTLRFKFSLTQKYFIKANVVGPKKYELEGKWDRAMTYTLTKGSSGAWSVVFDGLTSTPVP